MSCLLERRGVAPRRLQQQPAPSPPHAPSSPCHLRQSAACAETASLRAVVCERGSCGVVSGSGGAASGAAWHTVCARPPSTAHTPALARVLWLNSSSASTFMTAAALLRRLRDSAAAALPLQRVRASGLKAIVLLHFSISVLISRQSHNFRRQDVGRRPPPGRRAWRNQFHCSHPDAARARCRASTVFSRSP